MSSIDHQRSPRPQDIQRAYLLKTHSALSQVNKSYPDELIERARIYTSLLDAKKKIESEKGILAINSNKDRLIKEVDAMISFVLSRPKSDFSKTVRSDFLGWHNGKADFNDRGAQNQLSRRELLMRYIPTQSGDISTWLDGSEKRQPLTTVKIEDINTVLSALGESASSKLNQKIAAFHAGEKTIDDLEALQSAINKEFRNAPNLKALSDKSEVARVLRTLGQTEQAGALMVEYGQERRSDSSLRTYQDISRYITANTPKYQSEAAKQANIRLGQVLHALQGTPEYVTYGTPGEQKKMLDGYIALYSEQKAVEEYIKKYGDKNLPEVYKEYNDMKGLSGILNFSDENAKLTKEVAIMVAATLATLGTGALLSGAAASARVAAAGAQALNAEKTARGAHALSRGVTSVRAGYNTTKATTLGHLGRGAETFVGQAVVFTGVDTILRSTILSSDGQKNPTLESFAQKLALNTAMFGAFAGIGKIAEPLSKRVFGESLIFKNDINLGKGIILTTGDLTAMYALHVVETQKLELSGEELASMLSMVIVFRGAAPALGYTRDKIQAMRERLASKVGSTQKADDMITAEVAKAEKSTLAQAKETVQNFFNPKIENTKFVPKGLKQTFTDEQYESYIQVMSQKSDAERLSLASGLLNRDLTQKQKDAILKAHNTGEGSVHNWTQADLMAKSRILIKEAKFSPAEIRLLMERGITGKSSVAMQERDAIEMLSNPKRGDIIRIYNQEYRYTANGSRWQEKGEKGWHQQDYTEGKQLSTKELQEKLTSMLPPASRATPKQATIATKNTDTKAPANDTLPSYDRYLDISVAGYSLRLVNGKTESMILLKQNDRYAITSLDDLLKREANPNKHHTIRTQLEHEQKLFGNGNGIHTKVRADITKNNELLSDSNIYNIKNSYVYLDNLESDLKKQLPSGGLLSDETKVIQELLSDIKRIRGEINKIPKQGQVPSDIRNTLDQFEEKVRGYQASSQSTLKDVRTQSTPDRQASPLRIEHKPSTAPNKTTQDEAIPTGGNIVKPETPTRTTAEGTKAPSEHISADTRIPPAEANTPEKLSSWAKAAWIVGGLLLLGGILYMCSGDEENQTLTPIDPEDPVTLTPIGPTVTIDEACLASTPTDISSVIDWTRKIQDRMMTQQYRQGVSERFQQSAEYRAFAEYLEQNTALLSQKVACNDLVSLLTPPTPSNIQAIQSHIGMEAVDGKTGQDGILGTNTIKALRSYLDRELAKQ